MHVHLDLWSPKVIGLIVILMAYITMRPVGGSAGRADRGDRERSLDWDQRPVRKRPGASYMRFSLTVSGVAKRSPTAFLRRVARERDANVD